MPNANARKRYTVRRETDVCSSALSIATAFLLSRQTRKFITQRAQIARRLLDLLKRDALDIVTATSNEALQNLFDMAGPEGQPLLRRLPLVIPGHRQAELAARLGFVQGAVIAGHASDVAMADGVKQLVSRNDAKAQRKE